MGSTTVSPIRNMTNEYYLEQPNSMLELKLVMILDENPRYINALV